MEQRGSFGSAPGRIGVGLLSVLEGSGQAVLALRRFRLESRRPRAMIRFVLEALDRGGSGETGPVATGRGAVCRIPRCERQARCVRWCFALLQVWGCLGQASRSAAQGVESGIGLNWVRLPGAQACITAAELAQRVERRLERKIFVVDAAAAMSVDGAVQPSAAGFTVRLGLSDRSGRTLGERVLESGEPDCRTLDEAVVLVIAVTLFPQQLLAAGGGMNLEPGTERLLQELFQDEPAELDGSELEPAASVDSGSALAAHDGSASEMLRGASVMAPVHLARERQLLAVSASGIVTAGYLPGLAPGVELVFTLSPPGFWPLRLAAAYLLEQARSAPTLISGATSFGLSQASLAACPWQTGDALHGQLCAGVALGLLRTASTGYARGGVEQSDTMFDAQAQLDVQWRLLPHLLLQLGAGLALPFIQRRYAYQGLDAQAQQLFRTAQLTGRLGLGLAVGF